jgi:hypothetical protein
MVPVSAHSLTSIGSMAACTGGSRKSAVDARGRSEPQYGHLNSIIVHAPVFTQMLEFVWDVMVMVTVISGSREFHVDMAL